MLGPGSSESGAGPALRWLAEFLCLYPRFRPRRLSAGCTVHSSPSRPNSQRRENSILPSASVGTPLQVAGRYRQARTVCRTLRSPTRPTLCRIRGLCTRPSAPTIKLTLTLCRRRQEPLGDRAWSKPPAAAYLHNANVRSCAARRLNSEARPGALPDLMFALRQNRPAQTVEKKTARMQQQELRRSITKARVDEACCRPSIERGFAPYSLMIGKFGASQSAQDNYLLSIVCMNYTTAEDYRCEGNCTYWHRLGRH